MNIIKVNLKERTYPVYIHAPLNRIGNFINTTEPKNCQKALIISHPKLIKLYGKILHQSLSKAGITSHFGVIPEGEKSKNLTVVRKLYRQCIQFKLDRTSCMIALGGGVVGDVAGFVSATYLRGLPLVQIPTTLLAMVDSSIGGKTGVDMPEAKNSIGSFHQPKLVWIDISLLKTLPENEFRNGMAEIIKYGVIADKNLFKILEKKVLFSFSISHFYSLVNRCVRIKAEVVSKDEKETKGVREILNFGHTVGHAIETMTHYRSFKHGEAVAIGMCAAGFISEHLKLWGAQERLRMEQLIAKTGLPTRLKKNLSAKKIVETLFMDKKTQKGELRFVLPVKIGKVIVKKIPPQTALKGIEHIQK